MDIVDEHKATNSSKHEEHVKHDLPVKNLFADYLVSAPPACPECHNLLEHRKSEKCDYCGYHIGYLSKIFPSDLPTLERIMNYTDELNDKESYSLSKQIQSIEKRYPQLKIKLGLMPLNSDVEVQQMGLWMLNKCPLPTGADEDSRLWTIFILVNTLKRTSCYAIGYKAEISLPDTLTHHLVATLNRSFRNLLVPEAISANLELLLANLDHSKKELKKQFKRFKRK